jgi:hypothetical protein
MNVNFKKQTIGKPVGKRTPSGIITFHQLQEFINIWKVEIGPMLDSARAIINKWRKDKRPEAQIHDVLKGIVVGFGEGSRRPWPCIQRFLASPNGNNTTIANRAVTAVDGNIKKFTEANILSLFSQLAQIKGLGSKNTKHTSLISNCSYSSKVLRSLCDDYVVLDDLFEDELGERYYIDFRQKCEAIGKAMKPFRSPAEVESGLYAWLQILKPCQGKLRWKKYQTTSSAKGIL